MLLCSILHKVATAVLSFKAKAGRIATVILLLSGSLGARVAASIVAKERRPETLESVEVMSVLMNPVAGSVPI